MIFLGRNVAALCVLGLALACTTTPASKRRAHEATRAVDEHIESEWWKHDVFYEIFVRSFADTNGDGIGDLNGVTAHLDDLKALGVDDVWLMPIFPSPSYHGYDVVDEVGVNPQYGTLQDFARLIDEAHKRHMHVILDFVLNHTSDENPWFIASSSSPSDPKRAWYVWKTARDDRWRRPWDNAEVWREKNGAYYLGLFTSNMPDLNLSNEDVVQAMESAMKTWLDRGVDGFRLDAVRHLIESEHDGVVDMTDTQATHALLRRIHHDLQTQKKDVLLVAEAWSNNAVIAQYASSEETQLAFAFPTAAGIVDAVHDDDRGPFVEAVDGAIATFRDQSTLAPFLTNHDQARAMRDFAGNVDKAKLAAATLFALPGTPFVYYGEEIGMQGGEPKSDENKRTPMRWTSTTPSATWFSVDEKPGVDVADERQDPDSLWSCYHQLIGLHRNQRALSSSAIERIATHGGGRGVVALVRGQAADRVLFLANFNSTQSASFDSDVTATATKTLFARDLRGELSRGPSGVVVPPIGPHGFAFVELTN